jgi:TM2 domain-containing membrane protein YozV
MSLMQKQDLTTDELQLLNIELNNKRKSAGIAWLLWVFTSVLGGHRFYLGKIGTGVAMLLTFGGFGIWAFIDIFLINGMVRNANGKIENEVIAELRTIRQAKMNSEAVNA